MPQGWTGRSGAEEPCTRRTQLGGAALHGPRRMLAQAPAPREAEAAPSPDGNDPTAPAQPVKTPKAHLNHGGVAEALIAQRQHKRVEDAAAAAAAMAPQPAKAAPHKSHAGGRRLYLQRNTGLQLQL